ncbi:MAG: pyruvoyl-dependent arginine decarboxylase [candidate division WOR-3 bacterium]
MKSHLSGLPSRFCIGAGVGHGETELLAFDRALASAGFSDYNLVKVSSIIPPRATILDEPDLPLGSLLPIAYASLVSEDEGLVISAAVAAGLPISSEDVGVIMEFSGPVALAEAEAQVRFMAEKALVSRGIGVREILVRGASARVHGITAVFAGVALLP